MLLCLFGMIAVLLRRGHVPGVAVGPGVAADRHHRRRAAAADLHADEVGRAVRRVRRAGRRARSRHRLRVRPRRPAHPTQPRALRHRVAVRAGLGDIGHQCVVLRRQLRRAVVRQAAGDRRVPGHLHLPDPGDCDRPAGRLAALPDGLRRTHRGRQHRPQPGAGVHTAAGGRGHHGRARGGLDGQGCRAALSRLHHRQGQRRGTDLRAEQHQLRDGRRRAGRSRHQCRSAATGSGSALRLLRSPRWGEPRRVQPQRCQRHPGTRRARDGQSRHA